MKVTLEFDDVQAAENFMSWWLDGGGEQYLDYNTNTFNLKSGYMRVEGTGVSQDED